jgi:aminoglycoside phosphotransferase (APT) family kinase protein
MDAPELRRAVAAGVAVAAELGLNADDGVLLHNSNRIAVRLTPCDVLARVAPLAHQAIDNDLEVVVAHRLAQLAGPVAEPDPRVEPRVNACDGFAVTLWTYYEPVGSSEIGLGEYAKALVRLHAGLRQIEISAPHFTNRVAEAQRLIADPELTPELLDADRDLLGKTLSQLRSTITAASTDEQLLHGEPHPGNLLTTNEGLLFVDLETCCRGPVEFDIAHAPHGVAARYPAAKRDLVRDCRVLMGAMVTTWRWRHDDQLPNGRYWRIEGLHQLRAALNR